MLMIVYTIEEIDRMEDWINSIIKEGKKFILDFTNMYVERETLLGEIETLTLGCEVDQC